MRNSPTTNPLPTVWPAAITFSLYLALLYFLGTMIAVKMLPAAAPDTVFGIPTGDFATLWSAGTLASHHRLDLLYSSPHFEAWKAHAFGHQPAVNNWIYPPTVLPLGALAALLPLPLAFCLWDLLTFAAMIALLRRASLPWRAVAFCVLSPASLLNLIYGQYGGIMGCLTFAGLMLAQTRPRLAGIMLGFVTLKPQASLVIPAAWLASRNGRAIFAAGLVFAVLALLPAILFGPACWRWFFTSSLPMSTQLIEAPFGQGYQLAGISVFWMMRSLGSSLATAYAAQIAAALCAIIATYRLWRMPHTNLTAKAAATLCLSLFITPYGFAADMVGYTIALVALQHRRGPLAALPAGLLWLWPGYVPIITHFTGILLTPLFVLAATILACRQLQEKQPLF